MKRELEPLDLNLRDAFPPMPQACLDALTHAARSVKEEPPMKRASMKAAIIAIAILLVTAAVALAVSQLGWLDYFGEYNNIDMPKAAIDAMNATKPITKQVGPITFTVNELLADGHTALSSATARVTDGSRALCTTSFDVLDPIDSNRGVMSKRLGLPPETTWPDAARQLGLPLYSVRARIELDEQYDYGEAMEDLMWDEEGTVTYFNLASTKPEAIGDTLPARIFMVVRAYDTSTGEETERWDARVDVTIPVSTLIEEKTYKPAGDDKIAGLTLESIRAQQYATGAYLTISLRAQDGENRDAAMERVMKAILLTDENGERLPEGISLSAAYDDRAWPLISIECMVGSDALPGALTLTLAGDVVTLNP